jgi:subtilisin-like proprotein convertase family protein
MKTNHQRPIKWLTTAVILAIFLISGQPASMQKSMRTKDTGFNKERNTDSEKPSFPGSNEISVITLEDSKFENPDALKNIPAGNNLLVGTDQGEESEPNGSISEFDTLTGIEGRIRGNVFPNGDVDYYQFNATAGDRVYAAVMTSFSANGSSDSQLRLVDAADAVIEFDEDDGSLGTLSSSIAGTVIPATGTYFFRVNHFSATNQLRPYELYFSIESGVPTPEVEANDTPGTANPLPASGWVSGARNPAAAAEQDWYSMNLNAGDTVFLSLDLDPENDLTTWNGRLGFGLLGDANNQILVVDDGGTVDTEDSEAFIMTVKNAGTYFAFVDSASAATGGPTATYNLSVTVIPRTVGTCTTYTSTDVPQAIGPGTGLTSSTLTVPGNPRIETMRVLINATHTLMADMDVHLRSPAGNDNGIFTDIGAGGTGGQTMMDVVFDDYAGVPPIFTALRPVELKPELSYRLDWFHGEDAGGTWTLDIRDDGANASGGTLNSWALEICESPALAGPTIYFEDFESGAGGYTHSGVQDEWELGTPNTVIGAQNVIVNCFSGTNCWKTDLDNTYNPSSDQDLVSPLLNLTAYDGMLELEWAMRYQLEAAHFDGLFVEVQDVDDPANNRVVWRWNGATMTNGVGSPTVTIQETAGWGTYRANISDFIGRRIQVRFNLSSDNTIQMGGAAIDDVRIRNIAVTAANAAVGGRVTNANGIGIPQAIVTLTGLDGRVYSARTNPFGYYRINNVPVGENFVAAVNRKGYAFGTQIVTVLDNLTDLDFTAEE